MSRITPDRISTADRILVLGVSGSGKSTSTRRLACAISARPFDFDDHVLWAPACDGAWTHRSPAQQRQRAQNIAAHHRWVLASLGSECADVLLPRTDLIVYLAYPHRVTLSRLLRRTLRRVLFKEKACNGNRESLWRLFTRDSIIGWWWQTRNKPQTEIPQYDADPVAPAMVVLHHPRELNRLAEALAATSSDETTLSGES
ncbi:P-loop NTPase family protein [Rothia uropygialis]|uniref:adenylate kinase n=1 Tax=Kocuria sp. 36 TaxID=1415402 RepID=UPI00101BA524|nr:adenylate kinase [Kocuria sp. 36]